jgi:glycosyltransferase involved in cell wall biosynthesis
MHLLQKFVKHCEEQMIKQLGVIGHPSKLGGADTELEHQIILWRKMGIDVYICHTGDYDKNCLKMRQEMESLGCKYLQSERWQDLDGLDVISFCNGQFLEHLPKIKKYARTTTFVNCMTWNFPKELEMQKRKMIDFHLYQTQHQYDKVSVKLKKLGSHYKPLFFNPYFHNESFPFTERNNNDLFRFGRISRGDADKYGSTQVWIWETMTAPVLKSGTVLGWDYRAIKKLGNLPPYIIGYNEGVITQQELYRQCDVIIMTTDTFENLPRVGFEAMSSGSVLVVDNRGGWKVLVEDGKTGWLCKDCREFVYKASRSAFEIEETNELRIKAKNKLNKEWGEDKSANDWLKIFNSWSNL